MSTKIYSAAVIGLSCELVEVEADVVPNLPKFYIVGLPDVAVKESKQRVRSAIKNSGLTWPRGQINVNLAPADLKKAGPAYDLPIALSILIADSKLKLNPEDDRSIFVGELGLDGHLRPINGILSIAIMARDKKIKKIFLPKQNAPEASLIQGIEVYPIDSLSQIFLHLRQEKLIDNYKDGFNLDQFENKNKWNSKYDMAFIKGQEHVKRALEIAAAGQHNILMTGPPGSGKTLLARTMPTILPQMTIEESLEVTRIYSVAGILPGNKPLMDERPFRSPHHTASGVSLVGGGTWPKPGEISLAHRGVLFLDEFPEFPRSVLDSLRQPLEDGIINISRAAGTLQFPAKFILLASMNPCPCGFYNDPDRDCSCTQMQINNYQRKISGPLMDRIDIHIQVPRINFEKLSGEDAGEKSAKIRQRVNQARSRQTNRFKNMKLVNNSEMSSNEVRNICLIDSHSRDMLKNAVEQLHLSPRAYHRILKLSRTIADLGQSEKIEKQHIAEALQYRPRVE